MGWKNEMSYQNANSTLWTEAPLVFLSVPWWLHFPTKLVSSPSPTPSPPPPAPPSSFPYVFWKRRSVFHQQGQGPIACHPRVGDKSQATLCPLPSRCRAMRFLLSCALSRCSSAQHAAMWLHLDLHLDLNTKSSSLVTWYFRWSVYQTLWIYLRYGSGIGPIQSVRKREEKLGRWPGTFCLIFNEEQSDFFYCCFGVVANDSRFPIGVRSTTCATVFD